MQVGLNIKIKRIGRGYTQEEIADAIGVARSTYTRYESDKRLPDIYKLCALADYFDVSLDDLVGRDWKPKKDHTGRNIAIKPQPKCRGILEKVSGGSRIKAEGHDIQRL